MMPLPDYYSAILLAFIFASCIYKKHITDWRYFRFGTGAFLISVIFRASTYFGAGNQWWTILTGLYAISFLASGVWLVLSSLAGPGGTNEHLRCLKCGYILKGLSQPRCPECGQAI